MYLAHVKVSVDHDVPAIDMTFFCMHDSMHEMISLLGRYSKLINEINEREDVYRLLNVSNLGMSLSNTHILALGGIELSREVLSTLKTQRNQLVRDANNRLQLAQSLEVEIPDEEDTVIRGFNLPALSEAPKNVHPAVKKLLDNGQLWFSLDSGVYRLESGKIGKEIYVGSELYGAGFLVQTNNTFTLSHNAPKIEE